MSRLDDPGNYFQTSDSLATESRKATKAKNKHGDPIHLNSKLLAVCSDPLDSRAVYVSESAGEVKRVALETGEIQTLRPAIGAPLPCLTVVPESQQIFAGSWDKLIHPVHLHSQLPATKQAPLKGHSDFVKCLITTTLGPHHLLISGSADASIIVWNLSTNSVLHKIKTTGAQQALAIDPFSHETQTPGDDETFTLFSASSGPEIRQWRISLSSFRELDLPIRAHATSVYALRFDSSGDLWTASADKSARRLVRDRGWEADTALPHPDFVRDLVVAENAGVVVTACRDEDVRVWDLASGKLVVVYEGHFEEVTGLVVVKGEREVVSVSIDGTVRKWSLGREEMRLFGEERERERIGEERDEEDGGKSGEGMLTAEEEAELADLMGDED